MAEFNLIAKLFNILIVYLCILSLTSTLPTTHVNNYFHLLEAPKIYTGEALRNSLNSSSTIASIEKCTGPPNCAFCWNTTVRAIIRDFSYKIPSEDELGRWGEKVVLVYRQRVENNGAEDIYFRLNYSKTMTHAFTWSFLESFAFVGQTIIQSVYPIHPLFTPQNEDISIGKSGGLEDGQNLTWTNTVLYEKTHLVKLAPQETKLVSADSDWLKENKAFSVPFEATIEFIGNVRAACVQCSESDNESRPADDDGRNYICYEVYPSTEDVKEVLKHFNYQGEILYENADSGSVIGKVRGWHTGNYGFQENLIEE